MLVFDLKTRKAKKYPPRKNKLGVEDLSWNPRLNNLLVSYKDGALVLYDLDSGDEKEFERQGAGTSAA